MLTGCRGFEVVVLFCNLGFRPSLGARTYYILPRRMLGTPPCPGLACISVLALSGLVATTLNSEVAPALTEITIGLQFQFPAAALRLHSVACKTYVCRVHLPFRPAVFFLLLSMPANFMSMSWSLLYKGRTCPGITCKSPCISSV